VPLGTAAGGKCLHSELELRHPLGSPYNFFTWAEQIADFAHDVIHADSSEEANSEKVTLVANSIGTMSSLQSILDGPELFNGCFVINPNFRELHPAEVPFSKLAMPLVRRVQSLLREKGHGLFKTLATPETVTEILKEPYAVTSAIDDGLVSVLLDLLLTEGADEVVFDTLSYSAGPLPEQQLSSRLFPDDLPVWVVYGEDDPWTPAGRVENLRKNCIRPDGVYDESPVERVVALEGAGHCPHDEVPERVNGLILEFLDRLE
jgi:pimeloyl-ACP methyl ester carboxylesterase